MTGATPGSRGSSAAASDAQAFEDAAASVDAAGFGDSLAFDDAAAFEGWLEAEHGRARELWMRIAKVGGANTTVSYSDALDVALCFGWIDGQKRPGPPGFWLQRWTPRRARSGWSKVNVGRVEALEAAGRMRPAGREEVARAKADGRWDAAYSSQGTAVVPDDLAAALDARPGAAEFFAGLSSANRYAVLYRVETAKRPDTRARRIEALADMLAEGRTFH